jgi:HPr kinase/phosphorylase
MGDTPTTATLFQRYGKRLALSWIAGQAGENRPLDASDETPGTALVGHLNVIHPNRVQVIGPIELDYLNGLDAPTRQGLIQQLCAARPAALIMAAELTAPADLIAAANECQIPLFGSSHNNAKIISYLRHYLGAELTNKTVLHGVFMEVNGLGILISGESGVGKSELALELISRGHRLVADDAPEFSRVGPDTIRGRCPEAIRDFLEVRGLGILDIRAMYGDSAVKMSKDLRLIVRLERYSQDALPQADRLQGSYRQVTLLDTEVPEVTIPVAPGRNLAVLVEAAVRNHILLRKGYNAPEAFMDRQRKLIQQNQE